MPPEGAAEAVPEVEDVLIGARPGVATKKSSTP
jgi:hypothetical protein